MSSIIYPFIKVLGGKGNPNLKELENISPKQSIEYLMKPENMRGKYLGACLDSCRWGSMTTVAWETDIRGLMNVIQKWRDENNDNESLYHEMTIETLYKKFELPYINYDKCPRDKNHKETFKDGLGRLRCGNRTVNKYKPSFLEEYDAAFDELSQMKVKDIYENSPINPSYNGDEEWVYPEPEFSNYLKDIERYKLEKPTEEVVDVCYAIISDKNIPLAFETVLKRLDIQPPTEKFVEFSFDGWDLAYYLLRWKQQEDIFGTEPKWFAEKHENWHNTNSELYSRISSED